jgi:hypothetical protein
MCLSGSLLCRDHRSPLGFATLGRIQVELANLGGSGRFLLGARRMTV